MNNITVREFIEKFDKGEFDDPSVITQIDAGWYDWFCKDSSLVRKTQVLGKKVKQLAKSSKIDLDNYYVFFKNNCPLVWGLYDSFSFCNMETGDVIYYIAPRYSGNGKAQVFGRSNDFDTPLVEGSWKDVKEFFEV